MSRRTGITLTAYAAVMPLAEEELGGTDGCRDPDIRRLKRQIGR